MTENYELLLAEHLMLAGEPEKSKLLLDEHLKKASPSLSSNLLLATHYRQNGDLIKAKRLYQAILRAEPNNAVATLFLNRPKLKKNAAIMGKETFYPAPFYIKENFLAPDWQAALWTLVTEKTFRFDLARVLNVRKTESALNLNSRNSLALGNCPERTIFKKKFRHLIEPLIPKLINQLNLAPFETGHIELKVNAYKNGCYFQIHQDAHAPLPGDQKTNCTFDLRQISFVYYFHRAPKAFDGGDLLLYDMSQDKTKYNANFTRLIPMQNTFIAFPSHVMHEVTPIIEKTGNFLNSRFSINGHIQRKAIEK